MTAATAVSVAPTHASAVEPTADEAVQAMADAQLALEAYKAGRFEDCARLGLSSVEVIGPALGWDEDVVKIIAGTTIDALEKLGRNDEASALRDRVRAAMGLHDDSSSSTSAPAPGPSEETPDMRANRLAGEAMVAFLEGRTETAIARGEEAVAVLVAHDPAAATLPGFRGLLATLYEQRLDYARALTLHQANLDLARASGEAVGVSAALASLGSHYAARTDFQRAEASYLEALTLAQQACLAAQERAALSGLGDVALGREQNEVALARYREALAVAEHLDVIGTAHLLAPLLDVGVGLEESGRFAEAEPVLLRAVAVSESAYGKGSPLGWRARIALGRMYRSMARWDEAVATLQGVLTEQESVLPPDSPNLAGTLNHLAETLWAKGGEPKRTVGLATRAAEIHEKVTASLLQSGTEAQKRAYLRRYVSGTDRILSYNVDYVPGDVDATRLGMNTVLRRKGRVLDAVSDHWAAVRGRASETDASKLDRVREANGQLAALTLRGPTDSLPAAEHRAKVAALHAELETLEGELADLIPPDQRGSVVLQDVQAEIPADAVLVEWAVYHPFNARYDHYNAAFGAPHYAAWVLHHEGPPRVVDLGPAEKIDASVVALRRALAEPRTDPKAIARQLDRLAFAAVRPLLDGKQRVLASPDGMLNLVPLAALVGQDDKYLVESLEFTYLSSGRDLLRLRAHPDARTPPLIVGAPAFSTTGTAGVTGGTRSADLSAATFPPLPGTLDEVQALGKLMPRATVLTGDAATESALASAAGPSLLHVATHGFFLSDDEARGGTRGVNYVKGGKFEAPPQDENPLIRSGLALAGANLRSAPDGGDGILTALELSSIDLVGTELVVLSACETGVGEVRNGEGVYGLRRALVIAGSRSQLMSLWQVDDAATRDLMTRWYTQLERGKGRSESLRKVQRAMLHNKKTAHPFYWAAFIGSGDPGSMALSPKPPRQRRSGSRGSGEIKDYWRERFDTPMFVLDGGYVAPVRDADLDGAPAEQGVGFDLRLRSFLRPHVQFGVDYGRQPWLVQGPPRRLQVAINHLDFVLGFDLLALPAQWRVRPGIEPYAALALLWGRERDNPDTVTMLDTAERRLGVGAGATLGADGALWIRITDKLAIRLRGGISKPWYRFRAGGERTDYDKDFPRALRWQVGAGIGALPR